MKKLKVQNSNVESKIKNFVHDSRNFAKRRGGRYLQCQKMLILKADGGENCL